MKLKFFAFLFCFIHIFTLYTPAFAEFEKTKIAVLDFRLQGNDFKTDDMGKIVAEWLITAFVHEGRFEVIERKLLGEVLEEQKMVEAGIVDQETASEIGKLLGVKVIISGSVAKIGNLVEVNARIVDVASASIVTAESVSSSDITTLRELVREMASKIIKSFPLEGYIAHRKGNDVVIDLGTRSGVKSGMTFVSFQEGEIVKHPKTGEILYVTQIETGIIRITAVQDKISKGIILDEVEAESIRYGDMIKSTNNTQLTKLPKKKTTTPTVASGAAPLPDDDPFEKEVEDTIPSSSSLPEDNYSAQALQEDGSPLESELGRLFVNTQPENARIRILNIGPRYQPGIVLPAGRYNVEVSAAGYQTVQRWYELLPGEKKNIAIVLEKFKVSSSSKYLKYYVMIRSNNTKQVQEGAKYLYRHYRDVPEVRRTAAQVLSERYNDYPKDKYFADGMAYLCNILGVSGKAHYKSVLSSISKNAKNKKIKSYAAKNLKRLN